MLLTNYSDLSYVFSLDVDDFLELVQRMLENEQDKQLKEQEDKLYFRWVYESPYRDEAISFDEYKDKAFGNKKPKAERIKATKEDSDETIKRFEEISNRYLEKEGEDN